MISQPTATTTFVRCGPLLFYFLSANTISDVGVEALAKVLVGEYPGGREDDADEDINAEEREHPAIHDQDERTDRKTPILKTLDLGQVRRQTKMALLLFFRDNERIH